MAGAAQRRKLFDGICNVPASYMAAVAGAVAVSIRWRLAEGVGTHHIAWAPYYIAGMLIEWWAGRWQAVVTAFKGLVLGLWMVLLPRAVTGFWEGAFWAQVLGYRARSS